MQKTVSNFLHDRDFNVRVSVLGTYPKIEEEQNAYLELVRDSLGSEIVNRSCTFIGDYVSLHTDGTPEAKTFQARGKDIMSDLKDVILKSSIIRINIRLIQGGYKSWIVSRNTDDFLPITRKDFNIRTSILCGHYNSIPEKMEAYANLVRDSLGSVIVGSEATFMGNYTVIRGDGSRITYPFQLKGDSIMTNIAAALRKSVAVRINIRLIQGGYKSWIIVQ